jgi:Holliday junction resolvase
MPRASQRGVDRERRLRKLLRAQWVVVRPAMGAIDLVLMRRTDVMRLGAAASSEVRLVQVKSTSGGPYERFGPADRQILLDLAKEAGATAWLVWWPPNRELRWIPSHEWPVTPSVQPA